MARTSRPIIAFVQFLIFIGILEKVNCAYFGKSLGKLSELHHGVSGEVYVVDARTLYLKDFTYDGQGPAAYFYAGSSRSPGNGGFRLKDEKGSPAVIRRYRKEGVTLSLPEGKTLNNIKWFSVWCEEFEVNFGDVKIPRNFDYPRPRKIDAFKGVHGISSDNIVIVDAQTLLVPNLSYDGEAPDAKFWVGRGPKPSPQGVRVADENGKEVPLRRYDRKTVVLTLPGDLTIFDIGHFGIWCEAFTVDFGHIQIPHNLNVPPSLKMLGVSPQSKLNCEVLYDDLAFEVRWAIAGDSIVLQLVAKLENDEYMSFGVSGDESKSVMVGGDVVVAWVDKETLKGYADDYYLEAKSQCSGPTGSCPDERLEKNTNNIRLLNAAVVNGYSIVTYQRPLKASDQLDKQILTNESQPIIWALGPLNQRSEVSFHSEWTKGDRYIDFGRSPKWNCPKPETEQPGMKLLPQEPSKQPQFEEELTEPPPPTPPPTRSRNQQRRRGSTSRPETADSVAKDSEKTVSRTRQTERPTTLRDEPIREVPTPAPVVKRKAWDIPAIQCNEPEDGVFYAQMGPTGGKRGYPAITGHVGWGISWYINGLLIPEVNIVRGKTYTFVVEGGLDPEIAAKYHPFYITDDPIGGYEYKSDTEKEQVQIFAGAKRDSNGLLYPTGVGRLCHWTHQGDLEADDFESFGAYQRTLELKCDQGEPGVIQFTPDENTPDTLYYQCFTHRYLGWKINVLDNCDVESAASEVKPVVVSVDGKKVEDKQVGDLDNVDLENVEDLEESPSIRYETKVKAPSWVIDANKNETANSIVETDEKKVATSYIEINKTETLHVVTEATTVEIQNITTESSLKDVGSTNATVEDVIDIVKKDVAANNSDLVQLESSVPVIIQPQPNYVSPPLYIKNLAEQTPIAGPKTNLETSSGTTTLKPEVPLDLLSGEIRKEGKSENETDSNVQFKSGSYNLTNFILSNLNDPLKKENLGPGKFIIPHSYQSFKMKPLTRYASEMSIMRIPPNKPRPMMNNSPYKFQDPPIYLSQLKAAKVRPQSLIFMKRPPSASKLTQMVPPQITIKPIAAALIYPQKAIKPQLNVKISPSQASTEKAPSISKTEKPHAAPLVHTIPGKSHYNSEPPRKPAINTGFRPESIVVEGGFRPILSKDIESRIGNLQGPELEYESEIGIIDVHIEQPKKVPFGPVFVPSPEETVKVKFDKNKFLKKKNIKHKRGERKVGKQSEDEIAEAAERVDSFYLPPDDNHDEPIQHIVQPSNIDIPAGTVVSYDGKTVSGLSLTAKSLDSKIVLDSRSSKAAELVKFVPQFGPFKGELPPLDPKFINTNVPQLYNQGFLSRGLESPSPSYLPQTGKLVLIAQNEDKSEWREKREAHHTPEHTEQQLKEKQNSHADWNQLNEPNSSNIQRLSFRILYANVIFICVFKLLI